MNNLALKITAIYTDFPNQSAAIIQSANVLVLRNAYRILSGLNSLVDWLICYSGNGSGLYCNL